jgi:hypothetical protein
MEKNTSLCGINITFPKEINTNSFLKKLTQIRMHSPVTYTFIEGALEQVFSEELLPFTSILLRHC